ncbi:hypothetical protein B0J18DRAFT_436910 [Chaetomium sp. MPI-SDFR-AT-0129]|nr:hypothetical protein B0J18DRAFT_436910 [Chaetomium sp. MPI-SDFR-AT-0129]
MDPTSPVFQPRSMANRGISIGPQPPVTPNNTNHDSNEPADSWRTKCRLCGESLPSRNKLMRHLYRNHKPPRDKQKALKEGANIPPSPDPSSAPSPPDQQQSERASPPLSNTPPSEPPPTRSSVHPFLLLTDAQKTRFTLFVIFAIFTVAGNQIKEAEARGMNGSWLGQDNQDRQESQKSQEPLGNDHHNPQINTQSKPNDHQDHQEAMTKDDPSSLHGQGNQQPRHQTAPPPDPALGPRPPPRSNQTPSLYPGQDLRLRENGVALRELQLLPRDLERVKDTHVGNYEETPIPNSVMQELPETELEQGNFSDSDDEDGGVVLAGL